jgi:hypothetical protein
MEFLQHTNNPVDMKITGIKGRSEVLRSVSETLGMNSTRIVPPEDVLDKMEQEEKQEAQNGPINKEIDEAVTKGVGAGVKRIATELTAAGIAMQEDMGMGPPTHIGTEGAGAQPSANGGQPGAGHGTTGSIEQGARKAQGSQPSQPNKSMGPQTHLTGSQPKNPNSAVAGGVG